MIANSDYADHRALWHALRLVSAMAEHAESDTIVNLVVVMSVLLAAGVVFATRFRFLVLLAVGFCVVAAVLDIAEIVHQISRSEHGLAALATTVAVVHLTAAAMGVGLQRQHA